MKHWVFVCTQQHWQEAATFFNHLKEQGARVGCPIDPPVVETIESDRKDFFVRGIKKGLSQLSKQDSFYSQIVQNIFMNFDEFGIIKKHKKGFKCEMVFALLPNRKADTYAAIKKLCCLDYEHKMPSQCVLYSTIRDREKITAVASKVSHRYLGYESYRMSHVK